ncbi:VOC family protein [Actinomadura bangladeshensis]|uniref:VOC family protein n=1 Tax=Actinomadura bangladeshensis TaxID=453573 RepID=UPI00140536B6
MRHTGLRGHGAKSVSPTFEGFSPDAVRSDHRLPPIPPAWRDLCSCNDDFTALTIEGDVRLGFQRVGNPPPARWPDPTAPRRVHHDFSVDDLDAAEEGVLRAGAELAEHQPGGRRFRVFIDPAGHPLVPRRYQDVGPPG